MSSTVTKRQQARNERALQEIQKTVAGNDRCADCNAPNPAWASWNLGIFLCMRCAGLHRKLGTHVSKVKSLSMDSWTTEQVDSMRKMGNVSSNRQLNPRNVNAQIPVDVDEVDAAIEKHIRQKYEQRAYMVGSRSAPTTRHNTGSTATGSDEPPPLPPKPGKHWYSMRSTSSTLPKSSKHDLHEAPISSAIKVEERASKSGRSGLFGLRVTSVGNNFDQKLNMLKEMGFMNVKQNTDILKNVNGSLDRAVEILSRLNEELPSPESTRVPAPISKSPSSGLRLTKTRDTDAAAWEVKEPKRSATAPLPPLPTRSQSTEPVGNTWNPFLQPPTQSSLVSSMQNLTVDPGPRQQDQFSAAQPLSVQTTGNPWGLYMQPQQAMSVPAIPMQPFVQASPISSTNPFYQTTSPQSFTSSNPWSQQMTPQTGTPLTPHSNPFGIPWADQTPVPKPQQGLQNQHIASLNPFPTPQPQGNGIPTSQPNGGVFAPQQTGSPFASQQSVNPFVPQQANSPFASQQNVTQIQQTAALPQQNGLTQALSAQQAPVINDSRLPEVFASYTAQQQPMGYGTQASGQPQDFAASHLTGYTPQQPPALPAGGYQQQGFGMPSVRHDKSSIMALYNHPQMSQQRPLQTLPEDTVSAPVAPPQANNPFAFQQPNSITSHVSKESVDFQGFSQNGRHSPDAFAGLSSRFMR